MKALELSKYLINDFNTASPDGITHLKLQKLLYYIYVWGIVSENEVIEGYFYKWEKGPVNKEVFHYYKHYRYKPLPENLTEEITLEQKDKEFVKFIVSNYIQYDAITLSAMTHKDEPWQQTELNKIIPKDLIKDFYKKLNFAKNFPIAPDKSFYPVETDLHYSYVLDFPQGESGNVFAYKSYKEYLDLQKRSNEEFKEKFSEWIN